MSKGNMLLGQARGKVGDLVFQRLKGQQITKSRNRKPNNPKSNAQMTQRSIFASAGQFYSRALQAQFKFAYENKLEKESDYNVFMKLNAKKGIYMSPEMIENHAISIPAPWVTSRGTLQPLDPIWITYNGAQQVGVRVPFTAARAEYTLADVSNAIINEYNLQNGDIITLWCQSNNIEVTDDGEMDVAASDETTTRWYIKQFILDTASPDEFNSLFDDESNCKMILVPGQFNSKVLTLQISDEEGGWSDDIPAIGGAIVSRNVSGKVRTGSSVAMMNAKAQAVYKYYRSVEWQEEALLAWKATGEAILKGGEAVNGSGNSVQNIGVSDFTIEDNGDNTFSLDVSPENYNLSNFRATVSAGTLTKTAKATWTISGLTTTQQVNVTVTERVAGITKTKQIQFTGTTQYTLVPDTESVSSEYKVSSAFVTVQGLSGNIEASKASATSSNNQITATVKVAGSNNRFEVELRNTSNTNQTGSVTIGYEGAEPITVNVSLGTDDDPNEL